MASFGTRWFPKRGGVGASSLGGSAPNWVICDSSEASAMEKTLGLAGEVTDLTLRHARVRCSVDIRGATYLHWSNACARLLCQWIHMGFLGLELEEAYVFLPK